MKYVNEWTIMAAVLLISFKVIAADDINEEELKETFGQLVPYQVSQQDRTFPSPTPPTTPTSWDELATTLATSPYYTCFETKTFGNSCLGTQTVPFFVNRLQAIESAGTSKEKILDRQLGFIATTWTTWNIWQAETISGPTGQGFYPRRYPLIYKFLVNRSKQTTERKWLSWLGC